MTQPRLVVLAGPNGAGKTTTAPAILRDALAVREFVNADTIAQGRADFAFETTLASRSFAPWIRRLASEGYRFDLAFLWLPSSTMASERVAERVRLGGHFVPPDVVRRRYERGLRNFFRLYRELADTWYFFDNSAPARGRLVARGSRMVENEVVDVGLWKAIHAEWA